MGSLARIFQATISPEGLVTVPRPVREALNLRPGDRIVFDQDETGQVRLRAEGAPAAPPRPAGDLSLMQAIARTAQRSRTARPIDDPIGDYLIAEDERTKIRR